MKRAVGRGLCAAAFLGLALVAAFAAAPAAAQNSCTNCLQRPLVTSTPASGSTYYPGETIVVQVRPRSSPWVSITSASGPTLGLNVGGSVKSLSGNLQSQRFSYTYYDLGQVQTAWRDANVLEFRYTVVKGDRDTDGVSVAANALGGGNIGANVGGSSFGGGTWRPNISKNHSAMSAQSGHKVDTPAPSWSGVTAPDIIFYAGGSVSYRLPQVANAASAHNVSYSVTSARSLPTGYTLNASTGTITGSHASASARNSYTLRATDGFNRTADLTFHLQVSTDVGVESISITSNPGADKTYGKVAPFGTNDTITVRVDFTRRLSWVNPNVCLNIQIGGHTRQACNPSYNTNNAAVWDKVDFSYAVQASDWDSDGISFPTNPLGGGGTTSLIQFHRAGSGGGSRWVNRSFASIPDDANHKVRGEQTVPSFGSTATPSYSWVRGYAVSQALPPVPAATDGDGGVTYAIEGSLPAGLSFAAATRTISGTPTATQGATNYTLAATDADGDKGTLRFSIEILDLLFSISSPSVAEGATGATSTLEYDVTLNRAPGRQVTVAYAAAADPGTATSGTDYTAITGGTLTFAAAETSKTVEVTVTGDALDEPDETVRIALSNPSGAMLGSASTGVGTITDDDPTPTLALALSDPDPGNPDTINESGTGNATTVTASLSGGTSGEAITVTVAATGATAAAGDFSLSSTTTLTIAAGATTSSGAVTVTALDDATDEPAETVTVGGTRAGGHGLVAAPLDVTLTIADDDPTPTSALALMPASISESGGVATVTATLSNPSAAAVTVTVSAAPGTGAVAADFSLSSATTLTIAASATSSTGTVTVTANDNVVDSPDKSVTVSGSATGTLGAVDPPDATLTITDNDATPTSITLTVNDDSVGEGDGDATITVTATVDGTTRFGVDKTVTVSVAGSGTASAVDFAAVSDFDITIAAGAASKSETFTLSPTDDAVDETDETITVSGTSAGLTVNQDTITLSDDDATPTTITLSVSDNSVAEDDGATTITVTATVDGTTRFVDDTTVGVSVAGSGTAAAVDFAAVSSFNISIGAGEASGTETFTLTPTNDAVHEANETITVSGTSGALTVNSATITLTDDQALPTVALSLSPASIGEAGGTSTVTATLSAASSAAVTLTVGAAAGTGAVAADFSLSAAKTLTIAAGATTSTGTVTVTAADNDVDTANKSVTVSATATGGNGVAAPSDVTLTLTDDDTAGVTFSPATLTLTEQGPSQKFTMVLDSEPTGLVYVRFHPDPGISVKGAVEPDTYYWGSLDSSNWDTGITDRELTVAALADGNRQDEIRYVKYSMSGYGSLDAPFSNPRNGVKVTVIDDDKPVVSLSLSPSSISENGGVATVTATLDAASPATTTIMVTAATGTNAVASDFALSSANTLTIPAGSTTSTGTVTITAVNNALDEPDKSVTVSGAASNSDGVNQPADLMLTITDDEPAPTLSIDSPSVSEGNSGSRNLTFTATLSAASGRPVTVEYEDSRIGTATSGTDYTAIPGGTLTFAAGTTSQTFNVSVTGDVLDEADETVTVRLKDPVNAAVSTAIGTGTITNDDATPMLSISEPSVTEGDSGATALTYTVTLSAASGRPVTVRYADAGTGTATSGTDYTAITAGTLIFAAGTTSQTFSVLVTGDTVNESNETVVVNWSNATNAVISSRSGVVSAALRVDGTITDDDGPPTSITLTVDDNDVGEGDGATTITVTATVDGTTRFAAAKTVTVSVAGSGTTGAVNFDAVTDFNISIAAGAASGAGTFTLTPKDDLDDETDETITVSGTSSGLTVNPTTISLTDDDGVPTSITLTVNDDSVGEGDGATTITVTATLDGSTTLGSATTVRVSVAGSGTATAVDFDTVSDFDITIAAGDASGTADFTLTPTNDAVDEADETIAVRGTSGLTVNSATISLTDDDAAPTAITLTVSDSSVGEGDGATSITVTATVDGTTRFAEAKTVRVSVAGSGTAGAVDFAAVEAFDIEIAAEAASDTAGFTLTPTDDAVDETNETVTVSGTSDSLTVNAATITLADDDAAPTAITLTVDDNSVGEGDGAAPITVTATVDGTTRFAEDTTVTVSVAGSGTPTAVDFAVVSDFDITIPAGAASSTGSFTLTPTDDAVDETDETVTVSGTSGSLTVSDATITLTDDDAAPTAITLTVSDDSVSEGDGATSITVTATVDGTTRFATSTTVEVLVRGTSGTAMAVDFTQVSLFEIVIAAGAASGASDFTLTPTNDVLDETDETVTVYGASDDLTVNPATITLTDDDATPTAITLTVDDNSVAEDDGATTITVTATVDGGTRFIALTTVTVSVAGSGTASAVDFGAVSDFDVEIDAGDASGTGTFTLTPTNDVLDETNETITVSGTSGSLTVSSATITLTDDDATPSITLTVDDNSVAEDDGATTITVTATVDGTTRFVDATTVTVSVAGSGTATAVDFAAVSDFDIEIAAGAASANNTFTLTPTNDVVDETNETVTVSGTSGSLTVSSATITLTDDDATPSITLTVDDNSVAEDDGATTITVTATVDGTTRFAAATTVTVSVAGSGTATAVDFAAVSDFDITIAAGEASKTSTFTLTPTNDVVDETNETITVSGSSGSLTVNSATISLTDDDAAPMAITLTVDDDDVGEGDGTTTITVTATVDGTTRFATSTTVSVSVAGSGTATAVDFAAVSDFDITIPAGEGSGTGTFTLTPTVDADDETDETVTVSGSSGSLTVNSATISLTDDDGVPTSITLTVDDDDVGEGDGATTITVTASANGATGFTQPQTVRVSVGGSGTARAVDFAPVSDFDIMLPAGALSASEAFTLTPTDDTEDEADETITVSGVSGSLPVNSARISLTDDDGRTTSITLRVDDNSVGESDGATTITVTATLNGTGRFVDPKTVQVSVTGSGTATAVDFAAVPSFNITIAARAESGTGTFTLTPTDDAVDETNETIKVRGTASGLRVNSDAITLADDDATPDSISLTVNDNSVGESDGATTITVTATVDGATRFAEATTVTVSVAGSGTATAVDFAAVTDFDIEIAAEAASASETFTLTPTDDVVDETNETVTVSGTSGSLTVDSATITITDDDAAPTSITLTVNDNSVAEDDGATTITVTATVGGTTRFAAATTVTVSAAGSGTATAVDFAAVSDFDITIAAGMASGTSTFTLTPTNDTQDETDETITVSGTSGTLTVTSATISLTDDDATPTLSISSPSVSEGDSGSTSLTYTVTLSAASARQVTVQYADAGTGTATSGTDYTAITAGTLTFAAGTTSQTFSVSVTGDVLAESNETVVVALSSPTNAMISATAGSATGTITNDDAAPTSITLTVNDNSVGEDDGATTITVTATVDGATRFSAGTTVTVSVSDSGTATAVDFTAVSDFDITIAAGMASGTSTFTLTPTDDVVDETDETVTVSGSSGSLTVNSATISLTDDDAAPTAITLTVNDDSVAEDDGATTITVTATVDGTTRFAAATTVTVTVAGSGTATAVDFAAVANFDITIAAEAASANNTFTLTPTDDTLDEADETITVSGTSGSLTVNSDTITLADDDATPSLSIDSPIVAEGNAGAKDMTFTVTLSAASGQQVTVNYAVDSTDPGTATSGTDYAPVSAGTLTFAVGTTSETVTVSVTGDTTMEPDETVRLTLSGATNATLGAATGVGTIVSEDGVSLIRIDADPTTPSVDPGPLALNELSTDSAHSRSYSVRLKTPPTQDVTVTIASGDTGAVTVGDTDGGMPGTQNTLTFTAMNWSTARTVTLTAAQDDDGVDESVTVTHAASTASNSEYTGDSASLTATVADDETPAVVLDADPATANVVDAGPVMLVEGHATDMAKTYSVRLATEPTQTVTVTLTSADTGAVSIDDTDGDNTNGVQNTLVFASTTWDTVQTVTARAADDDDAADESVVLGAAASTATASEYTGVTASLTAAVDDDETRAMTLSATTLTVPENDSAMYTVQLTAQPVGGNVTVTITGAGDGITTNPTTLTFTPTNWSAAQNVTVSAASDANGIHESVPLTHTASGADYLSGVATVEIVATATDDDGPSLRVSSNTLTVREESSASYRVRLNTQPSANVTVTVSGATSQVTVDTDTDATGNQSTLTFTTTDWSTYQDVMVSAAADDDATDEMLTLGHTASGAAEYTGLHIGARPGVAVTVDDNDTPAIEIDADPTTSSVAPGPLALNEQPGHAANTKQYTVRLATEPTGAVQVSIESRDRAVSVDGDSTPRTRTLTFSTSNWSAAQTVTATAAEDDDASDERVAVTHDASGGDYGDVSATLTATTVDDDTPALLLATSTLAADGVHESSTGTYAVWLATEPSGTVTVAATATATATAGVEVDMDGSQAGVQSSLRFDATNWNTARTATVRGLPDDDAADGAATLRHAASGADYGGVTAADTTFDVHDDDAPAVLVGASSVNVNEGAMATYTVRLMTRPVGGNVIVAATSANAAAATVAPASMTFTASNWSAPRLATVRGVADGDTTNATATITHSASGADYDTVSAQVSVLVRDDDTAGVRIEPTALSLREGESGVYQVRLNTQPAADVTVQATTATAELGVDADATPQTRTLTFTMLNWHVEQTVTVTAGTDDGADDETLTVAHAVSNYSGVTSAPSLTVHVEDVDTAGMMFAPAGGLDLTEGDPASATGTYTVRLTAAPTGPATVSVSSDEAGVAVDTSVALGDQDVLTFDATNWAMAQTVTVRAEVDADAASETAALLHSASSGGYDGVSATYAVRVLDADAAPAPTSVVASAAGPTSLAVRWTPSPGAQGHMVQWRLAGQAWSTARQLTLPVGAFAAHIEGLTAGAEYEVRVLGLNRGDPGHASSSARATPRALGPANRAPVVIASLPDRALILGTTQLIDLSGVFWDPNGDALAYTAQSLRPSVLEASVSGAELRLRAAGIGTASVNVYATDPGDLTGSQTLRARVVDRVSLSADDAQAPEGGTAQVLVRLSPARSTSTRIVWSLAADADAATADMDDLVETSGEATVPAGATQIEIGIEIADDVEIEPAREWFEVALSAPDGCCGTVPVRARVTVLEGVCDRTPAVRDALRGSASCEAPTPETLAAVARLDVSSAGARSLRAGDFSGLSGLRTLLLDGNALRTLPDGLFAGLDSLGELSLDDNPGAPFALAVELARTDAGAWAPGPATVQARFALGAPFALRSQLSAVPAQAGLPELARIDAGATTSSASFMVPASTSTLRLLAEPTALPTARCGDAPCFRGVEAVPGEALVLYRRPPQAQTAPQPAPLEGGDHLRLALAKLIREGDGDLRWRVSSSDESVATAQVVGSSLVVTPEPGGKGPVEIVLEATDDAGLTATLRFDVQVEFHWPVRQASGWRAGALIEAARAASEPAPR